MILQRRKRLIGLGQGRSFLARRRAELGRHRHTPAGENATELLRRHEQGLRLGGDVFVRQADDLQVLGQFHEHGVLTGTLGLESSREQLLIHVKLGVDQHPCRHVDELHLTGRGEGGQFLKQTPGLVHVHAVVDTHVGLFLGGEVHQVLALGLVQGRGILDAQPVVLHQGFKTAAYVLGMEGPGHGQGVAEQLGVGAKPPHQQHEIKAVAVVGDNRQVVPGHGLGPSQDRLLAPDRIGLIIVELVGQRDKLGLGVGTVQNGVHLGQAVVLGPVGFCVYGKVLHGRPSVLSR